MIKSSHISSIHNRPKPGVPSRCRSGGFTLLEVMVVLMAVSALAFTLFIKTQSVSDQQQALDASHQMAVADAQLRQFAAQNGRLPCPDTGTDGVEDCGGSAAKGFLPYKTLGLATTQYKFGEIPMRYGVYRNATPDADLAVSTVRFNPTDMDGTSYVTATADALDLCTGLKNAAAATASTSYNYLSWPDASTANVAFAVGYAGDADADSVNGLYDGLNGAAGAGFNAPGTPVSSAYDDSTLSRGFNELHNMLRCDITQRSLDLAANAVATESDVVDLASANSVAANQGVVMNAIGTAITTWGLLQGIAAIAAASEVLGVSSGLLATAVATCVVLVGCAFIPVYTTAVTFAAVGLGLSIASAVLSGVALGLQITATVLYVGIQGAAGPPPGGSSPTYVSTPATQADINAAWNVNVASQVVAASAQSAYASGPATLAAAQTTASTAKTTMDNAIAASTGGSGPFLNPYIYGAGSRTVTPSSTPLAPSVTTVNSTCVPDAGQPSGFLCTPAIPYATTSSTTPVYYVIAPGAGSYCGSFFFAAGTYVFNTSQAQTSLKTPGCTTYESFSTTDTDVSTTYPTPGNAVTTVTTTVTNKLTTTTLTPDYVKGAQASINEYEVPYANYVVNGGYNPDPAEMNAAIALAYNTAVFEETFYGCAGCAAAVTAYLNAYKAQQLAYYKITDTPASGSIPIIPSPLLMKRDNTAASAETALDYYNTLVCSTGSTLVGAGGGTTPGGSGTGYNSASNLCISTTGGGAAGSPGVAASGAQNIFDVLRSLGSVK